MAERPRVLLADHDAHCVQTLEPAMKHITELTLASSTDDALQVVANGGVFDVVLVDVDLPSHGGLWLLEQIGRMVPHSKRVLLSAPRPEDFQRLLQAGICHDVVRKPALIDHLVAVVMGASPLGLPTQG